MLFLKSRSLSWELKVGRAQACEKPAGTASTEALTQEGDVWAHGREGSSGSWRSRRPWSASQGRRPQWGQPGRSAPSLPLDPRLHTQRPPTRGPETKALWAVTHLEPEDLVSLFLSQDSCRKDSLCPLQHWVLWSAGPLRRREEVASRGHPHHRRLCLPRQARDALINPLVPERDGRTPRGPLATSTDVFGRHKWAVDATAIQWVRPGMLLSNLQYIGWSPQQSHLDPNVNSANVAKHWLLCGI